MRKIAVVSGKGGTGKTTVCTSFSRLIAGKVMADCDVDAPNMHILLGGELVEKSEYKGAKEARIDPSTCIKCGRCRSVCRFEAISDKFEVISLKCEGCGACRVACPAGAIKLEDVRTGDVMISHTREGIFSHAQLDAGAEGSGKLVTEVRKNAVKYAGGAEWIIIDGSPGIGCSVIASITGCDAVLAIAESTLSGMEDLIRVLGVADHFKIPSYVCINKYDLNYEITQKIEEYCDKKDIPVVGRIPFDSAVVDALKEFKTPVEIEKSAAGREIKKMWEVLRSKINKEEEG